MIKIPEPPRGSPAISDALDRCGRVVALFSAAYFEPRILTRTGTTEECSASVVYVPGLKEGRLVPLRVEEVPAADIPAMLRPLLSHRDFGFPMESGGFRVSPWSAASHTRG